MKLEKAIAVLIDSQDMAKPFLLQGYDEAIKLLIKAGERVVKEREFPRGLCGALLPGETEE